MSGNFREAVLAQPGNLQAAHEAFADALGAVDLEARRHGTVVFSGIGASAHALMPSVLALREAGRRAFAISPSELSSPHAAGLADTFVLVSQSGASTETLAALEHLDPDTVIAITAHGKSALARAAGSWLPLGPLEDTQVATLSYTATLQALALLVDALLGTDSSWPDMPSLADGVLVRSDPILGEVAENFMSLRTLDAIGAGAAQASARETALLVREGLRLPAVGMETREYLHGPLEAVRDGFGCVVFGADRERELAAQLVSFGAEVLLIGDEAASTPLVHGVRIPRVPSLLAPILQILPVQLLVDHIARQQGTEVGELRRQQPDTKVA